MPDFWVVLTAAPNGWRRIKDERKAGADYSGPDVYKGIGQHY